VKPAHKGFSDGIRKLVSLYKKRLEKQADFVEN
jgi:hypothetical protein